MGSSASSLAPILTEDEVKGLCGDQYDQVLYDALKDHEGNVFSTDFMKIASSHEEREVLRLFHAYFPNGLMIDLGFVTLCRDAKLLSKALFTAKDAEKLFNKVKNDCPEPDLRGIRYKTWRYSVLPEIAIVRGLTMEVLITRLSRCEALITHINATRSEKQTLTVIEEPEENLLDNMQGNTGLGMLFNETQKKAVLKIQNQQRKKDAVKKTRRMSVVGLNPSVIIIIVFSSVFSVRFVRRLCQKRRFSM
jgi:hypothetical protein